MYRSTKYRIYPNKQQRILFEMHFGCVRFIYNYCLDKRAKLWKEHRKNITRYELSKHVTLLKREKDTVWLNDVNAQSIQSSIQHLDKAYKHFFQKDGGFPKFKNKIGKQSFEVPQYALVGENFIKIPKFEPIKAVISRPVIGKIKKITISKSATGKYFASVISQTDEENPSKVSITEEGTLGIDLGLTTFATLSTGEKIANPRPLKGALKRLRRAQRRFSKRKKGSNNRNKQRKVVAKIHEKVTNKRNDFLHKLTTRLVNENQVDSFAIEDLAVGNMLKNNRLSRSISDVGWGTFRRFLEYKAERKGKNVLVIGRFEPSSRKCSCGIINKELSLKDRTWTCTTCGTTHDRDILAACNIKNFALEQSQNLVPQELRELTPEECSQ